MTGAALHILAIMCGGAAITLLLHASPRRQPFGATRLSTSPTWLRRISTALIAAMFLTWSVAVGVERALFLGVFFLSLCGGGLLLVHAVCILRAARKQKNRKISGNPQP